MKAVLPVAQLKAVLKAVEQELTTASRLSLVVVGESRARDLTEETKEREVVLDEATDCRRNPEE